jgi:hypothetical protein
LILVCRILGTAETAKRAYNEGERFMNYKQICDRNWDYARSLPKNEAEWTPEQTEQMERYKTEARKALFAQERDKKIRAGLVILFLLSPSIPAMLNVDLVWILLWSLAVAFGMGYIMGRGSAPAIGIAQMVYEMIPGQAHDSKGCRLIRAGTPTCWACIVQDKLERAWK